MDFSMNIGGFQNSSGIKRQSPDEMLKQYMNANNCSEAEAKQALEAMYGASVQQGGYGANSLQSTSIFDIANSSNNNYSSSYNDFSENFGMAQAPQMPNFENSFISKIKDFFSPNKTQEGPQKPGDYDPTQEGQTQIAQDGPQKPGDYDPTQEGLNVAQNGPQKPGDYDPDTRGTECCPKRPAKTR